MRNLVKTSECWKRKGYDNRTNSGPNQQGGSDTQLESLIEQPFGYKVPWYYTLCSYAL